jgi:Right handed beta helix region
VSYTLRGRLESRLAATLAPLLVAGVLAGGIREWWPFLLAVLMIASGLALDAALYHRLLPYQPGWTAGPLGAIELTAVMVAALALGVRAPIGAAIAFFAASWLLAQVLGHAVFPLLHLSYGDDGGELGRFGPLAAATVLAVLAFSGGVAWGTRPPTVHLAAGVHRGPLVLDRPQVLVGEPGTVVEGGIVIRSNGVTVRDVAVRGGENGIVVDEVEDVVLDGVSVSDVALDGIHVRRSSVEIRDCRITLAAEWAQGIDVSFGFDLPETVVRGCVVTGGYEGIVSHFAHVDIRDNVVRDTALRAITVTEMSNGRVRRNVVADALGVGIFCGDYSACEIEDNRVTGTRADDASDDQTRGGFAILAHFGAIATIGDNELRGNTDGIGSFFEARILHR